MRKRALQNAAIEAQTVLDALKEALADALENEHEDALLKVRA